MCTPGKTGADMNAKGGAKMSATGQFLEWYGRLQSAVTEALNGPLKDGLKQAIREKAQTNVYNAYSGGGYRRGQIGAPQNLSASVNGYELEIRNVTPPQGSGASMTETGFVEEGAANYRQPFPRPFMDKALEAYTSGQAQDDLAAALGSRGFEVV
jgi:hypothetical protein